MTRRKPPRLVVRATVTTFGVVALVLSSVLVALGVNLREQVRTNVVEKLAAGQRMLSALEQRRARELGRLVATLAENPTLKAAIDTYRAEQATADKESSRELLATVEGELKKIADRTRPDILAVTSPSGKILAISGPRKADWISSAASKIEGSSEFVTMAGGVYRIASAPIALHDVELGRLQLATALDEHYAKELSELSGASMVIASNKAIVATTLSAEARQALKTDLLERRGEPFTLRLGRQTYAVQLLFQAGDAAVYSLDSIDASAGPALASFGQSALMIAFGAFALAGFASLWMAHTLAGPIDTLSRSLSAMTRSKTFEQSIAPTGSSEEVDALTESFNTMMQSVLAAEAETRSAYVGAIRALAMALDARDPYTAGHSERVSAISVAIGRHMGLDDEQLDVLRLGALLHDIGKIGVSDHVLRKPGALTAEEFEAIKQHPTLGARILRSVPFLARHLPIVELHHERPDGKGYPHGLTGDETPLLARIVHVGDAFDAMTSARAYRPARGSADALTELWTYAGAQFDAEVVQALAGVLPQIIATATQTAPAETALATSSRRMSLVGLGR